MSQLDIKIRKLQDNGSTFRANIETLYLGGVRSAKVDELRFELPEEWKNCTVTLHVQRLSGTKPDPQILDENNSVLVDRRWTLEKEGTWMLLAINDSGYIAMTKPGKYTCYDTIDTDTTTENITPSIYEQFVAEVTKYAKQALESMNAAKTSETNAKTSETNAKASADKAKASADSMDASVATCTKKAKEAEASAVRAKTSETNAKTSETNAKTSENAAKTSETNAKASENAAKSSETKSAASEERAKASETAAKQALQDTETEHTTALQNIAQARTAALNDVAASTKTATAAANAATQQATAAAGSASTADTKAGEASTSAEAAKADADRAEKASTNAANAAMKALKEAAASGAFKGDPGAQGPQGPSGTIIRAYDISLATSGWKATSDSSAKSAGLAYQYDASVSGCTSALEPSATIRLESVAVAQKAGLGSICQSESGYCRFYAAKVPSAAISLRLLLMERTPT
nr:MAG TPA: L SHAPED TAIL FIBER PROTEIN [Caudoviricetes sp.]